MIDGEFEPLRFLKIELLLLTHDRLAAPMKQFETLVILNSFSTSSFYIAENFFRYLK